MSSKKTLKENFSLSQLDTRQIILILGSGAFAIFVIIFYLLKVISSSQKIFIDPIPNPFEQLDSQELSISTATGEIQFQVVIANDNSTRSRGLMEVSSMRDNQGMLFIFPDNDYRTFWMKDTLIPLDMIFIDQEKKVVNIESNTTPNRTDIHYSSKYPAMYVLEVNAGVASANSITNGSTLNF
jgi:uncharacterized membrane protein (UPF0127 family)